MTVEMSAMWQVDFPETTEEGCVVVNIPEATDEGCVVAGDTETTDKGCVAVDLLRSENDS